MSEMLSVSAPIPTPTVALFSPSDHERVHSQFVVGHVPQFWLSHEICQRKHVTFGLVLSKMIASFHITFLAVRMAICKIEPLGSVVLKDLDITGNIDSAFASLNIRQTFTGVREVAEPHLSFEMDEHHILSTVSMTQNDDNYEYEVAEVCDPKLLYTVRRRRDMQRSINEVILKTKSITNHQNIEVKANLHVIGHQGRPNQIIFDLPFQGKNCPVSLSVNCNITNNQPITNVLISQVQAQFSGSILTVSNVNISERITITIETHDPIEPSAIKTTIREKQYIGLLLQAPRRSTPPPVELIVLVDNSGSMSGDSLIHAKRAVLALIRQFPAHCYFNVISFESDYCKFFDEIVPCSTVNIEAAEKKVSAIDAGGGTNLLEPMTFVYSQPRRSGFVRQIFLITDGYVGSRQEILALVSNDRSGSRIMTFGIGTGCDRVFVEELAARSSGRSMFVDPADIEKAVNLQWGFCNESLGGAIVNARVRLDGVKDIEIAPFPIPSLYLNSFTPVFIRTKDITRTLSTVMITGQADATDFNQTIQVRPRQTEVELDKFWAVDWIRDGEEALGSTPFEERQEFANEIVGESISAGVMSILTTRILKANGVVFQPFTEAQEASRERLLNSIQGREEQAQAAAQLTSQSATTTSIQSSPCEQFGPLPDRPLVTFPDRNFPQNVVQEYGGYRSTSAELKQLERHQFIATIVPDLREGAIVHRRVREWAMANVIRPGVNLYELCSAIEDATRKLVDYQPKTRGLAFPCGASINNCAAHDSPTRNDGRVLQPDDVMKVDFGVNINGHIIDSAWTVCFDEKFAPLLEAAREATAVGIRTAGIDVRLCDIGCAIQEVFDAASYEINGKTYQVKPISNLGGHLLEPYTIHAGKSIPLVGGGSDVKMEEGELYACETFGTTGEGRVRDHGDQVSHFMVSPTPQIPRTSEQRKLLKTLQDNFSTLGFCQRFIDHIGLKQYQLNLQRLVDLGAVNPYPPLADVKGSHVAQFKHTFILLPTHKEILSRGDDY
jgi:methionyl aminopeptidase